jgi:hypothetical protein
VEGFKVKKAICLLIAVMLVPSAAGAIVFDRQESEAESIAPGITAFGLDVKYMRINGRNAEIKRYESPEPVKKVLETCLEKAEKQGSRLVNNQFLWLAANTLYKAAADAAEPDSFGYIFMVDKKHTATFIVAGASGGNTEIIKSEISNYGGKAGDGYDDGLKHFSGAEKVLSIELLSGGRTINFGNFYRLCGAGMPEILNYYSGEFRKTGLKILKKEFTEEAGRYLIKAGGRELFVNIGPQENGEIIVFVMG